MPQCTRRGLEAGRRRDATRGGRDTDVGAAGERRCVSHAAPPAARRPGWDGGAPQHRVLAAAPEVRAGVAVGHDLLWQPDVRHDREPEVHEVGRRVGEGAQLLEACHGRAAHQLVDELPARAPRLRASWLTTSERTSLDVAAERRQLGAGDDHGRPGSTTTKRCAWTAISPSSRGSRWPFGEMLDDQRMNRAARIGGGAAA